MNVITHSLTARDLGSGYSEFDWFWYLGIGPKPFSALPPRVLYLTLALKLFRREPAITGFD
jgi:hypothetical protein